MLVGVYTCQNATLLEITCCGSYTYCTESTMEPLTLCMLCNCPCFVKIYCFTNDLSGTFECQTVWSNLGPNCLLMLTAGNKSHR